jgi:hypothetical protein
VKETLSFVEIWMKLEIIILSKSARYRKTIVHDFSPMWNVKKLSSWRRERESGYQRPGRVERRRHWENGEWCEDIARQRHEAWCTVTQRCLTI